MSRQKTRLTQTRKDRGFTMIELMATVAVLAILTLVALPSYRTFVVGQGIKSASFDIMATLMLARSEAIKRNTNVAVTPISGSWQNGWTVAAGTTTLTQRAALKTGVSVACSDASGNPVTPCPVLTYNNSGRLAAGTVTSAPSIVLSSAETTGVATRCISVDLTGRPYSKKVSCP